jgi:hypothetical protein
MNPSHVDPSREPVPSRREFLWVGLAGGLGLTLGDALRAQETLKIKSVEGVAKGVIHIFLPGGMAAQESFDPKLYAPVEYRGPLSPIPTKIDGAFFSQLFPNLAGEADKITVVRAMTHSEAAHERGTHNMFTGYRPSPAIQYPSIGSVISHEFGSRKNLPPYVCVPSVPNEYAGSGYLSNAYGPFSLGADPGNNNFRVRDLALPERVDEKRFTQRRSLLEIVDDHFRALEKSDALDAMDSFYQRAYGMISSPEARAAFDLAAEPDAVKNEYGRHAPGQRLLLARRLVEAGVRLVSTTIGGWDHHDNINGAFRGQAPPLDQALATLVRDLDRRGLLASTLVMVTTEFGRTPKINGTGGRDHYPKVFSILLAGGGVKRGFIYGKSNAVSTEPDEDGLEVADWATTMYKLLGIDAGKELMAPGNRPIEIVDGGNVVQELLA